MTPRHGTDITIASRSWAPQLRLGVCLGLLACLLLLAPQATAQDRAAQCVAAHGQGQLTRDTGLFLEARELFVSCTVEGCPSPIRVDCARLLSDLDEMMPSVVFAARDATGADVLSALVFVDDEPIRGALNGRAVRINPGPHVFRFVHPDGQEVSLRALVSEGVKRRLIEGTFQPSPASPAVIGEAPPRARERSAKFPVVPVVLAGIGTIALGSFAYFGLSGRQRQHTLERSCAPDCSESQRNEVQATYLLADASLLAAIAAWGSGAYLYVSRPHDPDSRENKTGYALVVGGRF